MKIPLKIPYLERIPFIIPYLEKNPFIFPYLDKDGTKKQKTQKQKPGLKPRKPKRDQ